LVPDDDRPAAGDHGARLPSVEDYPFPFEGERARLRARRSLAPENCPPPPVQLQTRSTLAVVGRLVFVVVVAAIIALFAIEEFPIPSGWKASGDKMMELAAAVSRPAPAPASAQRTAPRLVGVGGRAAAGEPAPVGVTLEGNADGAAAMIHGVPSGVTVSMGEAVGVSSWRVAVADLPSTWVLPAQDFVGTIDLAVELRLADDVVADRRTVRLEWAAPAQQPVAARPVATAPVAAAPATPAPVAAAPVAAQTDPEGIATLIKRGEDFIATGDLAAARVVLQRAAEARDAGAALALAATYDPLVLAQLKVYGFSADVAMARLWYEKAREFGSLEAPRRLELLASQSR
jgi:hypothetical protein